MYVSFATGHFLTFTHIRKRALRPYPNPSRRGLVTGPLADPSRSNQAAIESDLKAFVKLLTIHERWHYCRVVISLLPKNTSDKT